MKVTQQVAPQAKPEGKVMKASKPRIDCIDGCRFALVLPIVIAHFARFSTKNKTLLKIMTQENVLVGGFFVISGYVAAYTATKLREKSADEKKLAKPELFFWQKVMSYYPLHFMVSNLFAPMFIMVERWYNTPWETTAFRAFLNYSLLQAWFPKEAEIWNQPTWFLSALTFANVTMPAILPRVAALSKSGLRKLFCGLTAVSVLQKLSYSETARFHMHNISQKRAQYPLIWNLTRFHPFWALIEMTMGIAACREVMLDKEEKVAADLDAHPAAQSAGSVEVVSHKEACLLDLLQSKGLNSDLRSQLQNLEKAKRTALNNSDFVKAQAITSKADTLIAEASGARMTGESCGCNGAASLKPSCLLDLLQSKGLSSDLKAKLQSFETQKRSALDQGDFVKAQDLQMKSDTLIAEANPATASWVARAPSAKRQGEVWGPQVAKRDKPSRTPPLVYFAAAYSTLLLRLTSFDFNDAIIRSTLFVPLYTKFLTSVHRDCLSANPTAITRFFGSKVMTKLGSLAFPMFILHGPIGQIFYKKALAERIWGKAMPNAFFPIYLAIVLLCSHGVNEYFVKSKEVGRISGQVAQWLAARTEGMLQDRDA